MRWRLYRDLAQSPHRMNASQLRFIGLRALLQSGYGRLAAIGQFELRFLPDALVAMGQQLDQFVGGPLLESLGQQRLHLLDDRILHRLRIEDVIDAAHAADFPTLTQSVTIRAACGPKTISVASVFQTKSVQLGHFEAGALAAPW